MTDSFKIDHPEPFLEVRIKDASAIPHLYNFCAGYEMGEWRSEQLAEHVMEWLPEFALKYSEWKNLGSANAVRLIKKAAKLIFESDDFKLRGEFGEILLHIMIRQSFSTVPAISKLYYKDSRNDTVKGFDCVHTVLIDDKLELWLGEAKFYSDIYKAISDVITELEHHTTRNYLRDEFIAITNKIDSEWPYSEKFKKLLDPNTSLDKIFEVTCIPVLLTYNSKTINAHNKISDKFIQDMEIEIKNFYKLFSSKKLPQNIKIYLFLFPLKDKNDLNKKLYDNLQRLN